MADNNGTSGLQQAAAASACAASIVVAVSAALVARHAIRTLSGADRTRRRIEDGISRIEPGLRRFMDLAARLQAALDTAESAGGEMRRTVEAVKRSAVGDLLGGRDTRE